jgi:heat shock protein HspQ
MNRSRKNMQTRAKIVQDMVAKHYEPGRQDKCKLWVFRNVIIKIYPMSERTFFRYLAMPAENEENQVPEEDKRQLKLF